MSRNDTVTLLFKYNNIELTRTQRIQPGDFARFYEIVNNFFDWAVTEPELLLLADKYPDKITADILTEAKEDGFSASITLCEIFDRDFVVLDVDGVRDSEHTYKISWGT